MITSYEQKAKDLLYEIDYDLAKEIEADDDWDGSVVFNSIYHALIDAFNDGYGRAEIEYNVAEKH